MSCRRLACRMGVSGFGMSAIPGVQANANLLHLRIADGERVADHLWKQEGPLLDVHLRNPTGTREGLCFWGDCLGGSPQAWT